MRPEGGTGGGDGWRRTDGWTVTKAGAMGWEGGKQAKQDFLNPIVRHCSEAQKDFLFFSMARLDVLSSYPDFQILEKNRFLVH